MIESLPLTMNDKPFLPFDGWGGYFRKKDPTVLSPNVLTFPSVNCFVPDTDRVVPRKGKRLLGQQFTDNAGVVGHRKKYTNVFGLEFEVRVWPSGDARGDVVEVLYTDELTQAVSWISLAEAANPLTIGVNDRYYFDEWFDTELSGISLNLQRLIWVNGTNDIFSWTGGIAPIIGVTPTTITTTAGTTWAQQGFVDPAFGGSGNIVVNGTAYVITGGWGTDTLTMASTAGINVNDIATAQIEVDSAPTDVTFDMIRQNNNYCMYGTWSERNLYISNAFNKIATQDITGVQATKNDMTVGGSYTGAGNPVYRVSIDSSTPTTEFISGGQSNLDDGVWDTSGYSGVDGDENVYTLNVLADFTLITPTGAGGFLPFVPGIGSIIQGATTAAEGRVVSVIINHPNLLGFDVFGISMNTDIRFEFAETLIYKGTLSTALCQGATSTNWVQGLKNGAVVPLTTQFGPQPVTNLLTGTAINFPDGIDITFGQFQGHAVGDTFRLTINTGSDDTYQFQLLGQPPAVGDTFIAITGLQQSIGNGLTIQFVDTNGHTTGDYWDIQANQEITRGWANFYYTVPVRKPGEGYVARLPSNFWTMAPQEKEMYVNTTHGQWMIVNLQLSADLTSEVIVVDPLKQTTANKVLYPYMIGYLENDLIYVTEDKRLDMIGRRQLIQLPQIGTLSDPVELDFLEAGFVGGSIEYNDKKLWITSPKDFTMFCFDHMKMYWQPPQEFSENGILSVVGNKLITHSGLRNQTFTLFEGTNDEGPDGNEFEYLVRVRTPYQSFGSRWQKKESSLSFIEGYIEGNPQLDLKVLMDIQGCAGIHNHIVKPTICIPDSDAPLGKGAFGSHGLGNDKFQNRPYFREISNDFPIMEYYFFAMELECSSINQSWELLSMGVNACISSNNNSTLVTDKKIKIR